MIETVLQLVWLHMCIYKINIQLYIIVYIYIIELEDDDRMENQSRISFAYQKHRMKAHGIVRRVSSPTFVAYSAIYIYVIYSERLREPKLLNVVFCF